MQGFVCSLTKLFDRDLTNDKHNFVSFAFSYQIVLLPLPSHPAVMSLSHPVAIMCKIIPQN